MGNKRRSFKSPYRAVWVEWVDSCEPTENAEVEKHEIPDLQIIVQIGHLVKETESSLSIAGAWKAELETFDYVITIPKVSVVQMGDLK